jgi:hypothetical protein
MVSTYLDLMFISSTHEVFKYILELVGTLPRLNEYKEILFL